MGSHRLSRAASDGPESEACRGHGEYLAAREGVALGTRRARRILRVHGRAPGDMLNRILTNRVSDGEDGRGLDPPPGRWLYAALLTAKGRMITDLRLFRDPGGGFLLDLPEEGAEGALAHFKTFLPPRLASVDDRTGDFSLFTLLGPEAPHRLVEATAMMGFPGVAQEVAELREGEEILVPMEGMFPLRIVGIGDFHAPGWDVFLSRDMAARFGEGLAEVGVPPLSRNTMEILRVERGRPAFGRDMDESTIPLEAGIGTRAISFDKGCYTGQEVVIRIRDRGHVNKELRGLLLGDTPVPPPGTDLFEEGEEKRVGWITSAVPSPAYRQTIALGYVMRRVGVGARLHLGERDGPPGLVRALGDEGWIPS